MDDIISRRYTRELLESLSETEVQLTERAMVRHINALRSASKSTGDFEVELCYIQDEINRRAAMAAAAAEYAKRNNPGWSLQGDQTGVDAE